MNSYRESPLGRDLARSMLAVAVAMTVAMVVAQVTIVSAHADFGVSSFTTSVDTTQAGGHPNAETAFAFNALSATATDGNVKDINLDLPAGLVGNPQATTQCSQAAFSNYTCPTSSQVGVAIVTTALPTTVPVYNLAPNPGQVAAFGLKVFTQNAIVVARVRSGGDFGLSVLTANIPSSPNLRGVDLTFWGVPADASHDAMRFRPGASTPGDATGNPIASQLRPVPFMTNPTTCGAPAPTTTLSVDSWLDPGHFIDYTAASPAVTGCDKLSFEPSISVVPETTQASAPSGYDVDLETPQNGAPAQLSPPTLRDAIVTLPEGVSISPSAADGLKGCSDDQFSVHTDAAATCPDASKIGTTTIDTPVLAAPLTGSIYLGTPTDEHMYRLFLEVAGSGLRVKLAGSVDADPDTGQLTATFSDNPQLPFTSFRLHFTGGPRAALANPDTCGTKTVTTHLTSWGGPDRSPSSTFTIDGDGHGGACPLVRPFAPKFTAGTLNPLAAAFSPFTMTISRTDDQQYLSDVSLNMPPGLLGVVRGVPRCTEADAAAGTCSDASQVGTTTVSAGPGSHPYSLVGKVFLAGAYKGAPFSLSIVVHAVAGPYDLGLVVVRAPIEVDAQHAKLAVPADELPTILKGVPLRIRSITVTLDRPGFTFNATNCSTAAIGATLRSTAGTLITTGSPYQASGCANLPFHPVLHATTSSNLKFKQGALLKTHISQTPGESNVKSVAVTLPKGLPSRLVPTINHACLISQFRANFLKCDTDSYVGTVRATTPVLNGSLGGPVFIVAIPHEKPIIAVMLIGQGENEGINLELDGTIIVDSGGGRSKVTFNTVPDVPLSSFDLDLPAGPHSALDAPLQNLCDGPITMGVSMVGQNGKRQDWNEPVNVTDCPKITAPKIVKVTNSANEVITRVRPPLPGRIVVSSGSLTPAVRHADRVLTYSVHTRITKSARARLRAHRSIKTKVEVWYKPDNGPKAITVTKTVTIRLPAARSGRRR